ncbi:unnamed protein product [Cyprideis torosa]|uniref:Uncharacterized protein n=1 Tax=Cyprideis torosa TaxID=163714 RepID=A0A7R8WI92_9CRUS|nr:unnamed protein product [Cyprideis torosa]CAG0893860.1 unnamed protein product [Cyprideis torosa]
MAAEETENARSLFNPGISQILTVRFVSEGVQKVLITKLRSQSSLGSAESQQYLKAAKALFVLIPLLGGTYLIVLAGPSEGKSGMIFRHIQAFLLSTQGLWVSLLYCFFNSEVRSTIHHHWDRWMDQRTVGNTATDSARAQISLKTFVSGGGRSRRGCSANHSELTLATFAPNGGTLEYQCATPIPNSPKLPATEHQSLLAPPSKSPSLSAKSESHV